MMTDSLIEEYKDELKESYAATLKIMEKRYDWLRAIVTMAAGIIGVVVALRSGRLESWTEYWIFCASILLLCTGVMTGCIALYGEHMSLIFIQKGIIENRLKRLDSSYVKETTPFNPWWRHFERATIGLLALGLIALVALALVSNIPECR